jgi:dihydroneopterin aldolase
MIARIHLHGMSFHGFHGVYPEEKRQGQPFVVDLVLTVDIAAAAASDRLEDTVDYGAVHGICRRIVVGERYQLLEALAARLLDSVLAECPRVIEATVTVKKPAVALGGPLDHAAVELTRRRA